MVQLPNPSPSVLQTQRACPAAVSAQHPLGNPGSGTAQPGGASSLGTRGITLLLSPAADSGPGWEMLDLPTTLCLAGTPTTRPPPPSSSQPWCQPPSWKSTSGLQGARPGFTPRDPPTSTEELRAPRAVPAWLPQSRADPGVLPGPSSLLPGPAGSVSCHPAPVNNSPSLSPLFPRRYL